MPFILESDHDRGYVQVLECLIELLGLTNRSPKVILTPS